MFGDYMPYARINPIIKIHRLAALAVPFTNGAVLT
jgi:hypothetical protein